MSEYLVVIALISLWGIIRNRRSIRDGCFHSFVRATGDNSSVETTVCKKCKRYYGAVKYGFDDMVRFNGTFTGNEPKVIARYNHRDALCHPVDNRAPIDKMSWRELE